MDLLSFSSSQLADTTQCFLESLMVYALRAESDYFVMHNNKQRPKEGIWAGAERKFFKKFSGFGRSILSNVNINIFLFCHIDG